MKKNIQNKNKDSVKKELKRQWGTEKNYQPLPNIHFNPSSSKIAFSRPEGTYPEWSGTTIYNGGDRVLFQGIPFQAKWWNQGDSPAASAANPDSSPWLPLSQKEINKILNDLGSNQ